MAPVIPTPRNQREKRGPTYPQLEQLQQQLNRLGPYKVDTDGEWEFGGEGMDAPFSPPTDTSSHKGGGSIVFLTTNLERISKSRQCEDREETADPIFVVIRIEHGERVGRGPNPQELLALLGLRQSHSGWSQANLTTYRSTQTASHWWTMLTIIGIHECVMQRVNYPS